MGYKGWVPYFWNDNWICQVGPLRTFYKGSDQPDDTLRFCDVVNGNGNWDWVRLRSFILGHIVLQVVPILPPSIDVATDQLS